MAINPITLETPSAAEAPLQDTLNEALVRELLQRTKGAGVALLLAVFLLWLIVRGRTGTLVFVQFLVVVGLVVIRIVGAGWLERRKRFDHMRAFYWFAAMNFLIGGGLGAIVIASYPQLPPLGVAMCSVCVVGINSAAMVSLAGSPLVYLLYVCSNMVALTFVSFAHPLQGLEHPFQAMQFIYGAALIVMMRSVHRSLRGNMVLRLQLAASLGELRDTQSKLLDASREAGRADVAVAVLHSVGNVLNSVNVSAALATETIAKSRVHNLPKIMALVQEHRGDLAGFFERDPRGQKLPDYCAQLAESVERDNDAAVAELASVTRNIELINAVVHAQQEQARTTSVLETVDVRGLLDEVLEAHAASLERDGIAVDRRFEDLPPVRIDRYKVLRILLVLMVNARDALAGAADRPITVRARRGEAGRVEIVVEDSGCGIAPDQQDLIFSLGYSTKPGRHGLGLHFSACAARELGGALTVRSAGVGAGATFLLALPPGDADSAPRARRDQATAGAAALGPPPM